MAAQPAIVVALSQPQRDEVVEAMTDAGFETIALPPGTPLAEALSPANPVLVDNCPGLAAAGAVIFGLRGDRLAAKPGVLAPGNFESTRAFILRLTHDRARAHDAPGHWRPPAK